MQSPDFTPKLLTLQVTPTSFTLGTGESKQLTAIGTFSVPPGGGSNTVRDITNEVNWSATNSGTVATVDATGLVTAVGAGSSVITASLDGLKANSTLNGLGVVLREVVVSQPSPVLPRGTATYIARGIYSDSAEPRDITNAAINWTLDPSTLGTFNVTTGKTVNLTAGDTTGIATVFATVVTGEGPVQGTAQFIVAQLTGITVAPKTASKPLGIAQEFTATGTFAPPTGSSAVLVRPVEAVWSATTTAATAPTLDALCANSAAAASCKVTGRAVGDVAIKASFRGFEDTATLTVTPPVLQRVAITPDPLTVTPRTTPDTLALPLGGTQNLFALYFYSDFPDTALVAPKAGDAGVTWASSVPATATLAAGANNSVTVKTVAKGKTNVSATVGTIGDSVEVTVGDAALSQLLSVRPSKAYVAVNRSVEFVAVGRYSDGSTADVDDTAVTWTSANTGIATVNANGLATAGGTVNLAGTKIKATMVANTASSAEASLVVTGEGCETPLFASDGATFDVPPPLGLCVLCGVSNPGNVIDANISNSASINVPVGLLNASQGLDVKASVGAPYTVPFAAGKKPAFLIARPAGTLVLAEVFSQVRLSTLLGGTVQENSSDLIPLRVDLLGLQLIDGVEQDVALVSMNTALPYDGMRLSFVSGAASALTNVNVVAACGTSVPPAVAASGIGSISADSNTISVGNTTFLKAFDFANPDVELNVDDINWTSSRNDIATVSATGVVTGVAVGAATITGTLKDTSRCGGNCSKSVVINVTANYCAIPLEAPAVTVESSVGGLCLFCTVENVNNVIDGSDDTFSNAYVPVGLLGGQVSLTVTPAVAGVTFPAGRVGFLVSQPSNGLAVVELLSQLSVETLDASGAVLQSSSATVPLRLDLLGMSVTGSQNGVVSFPVTTPYKSLRLRFSSGVATVLSQLYVNSACAAVTIP